jgi:2-isopropylmalate synthase
LKNPQAYQPFNPKDVGQEISFVFGPLSGSNHAQSIIKNHGYSCTNDEKTTITQFIKDFYSTRRKGLTETEFMNAYFKYRSPIKMASYQYKKTNEITKIIVEGQINGTPAKIESEAKTAITALHKSLENYLSPLHIESYRSKSKGKGKNAISHSTISITSSNQIFKGIGDDVDIEVSALKALINAVNIAIINDKYSLQVKQKAS